MIPSPALQKKTAEEQLAKAKKDRAQAEEQVAALEGGPELSNARNRLKNATTMIALMEKKLAQLAAYQEAKKGEGG